MIDNYINSFIICFILNINIPVNTKAKVYLSKLENDNVVVKMDGKKRDWEIDGNFVVIDDVGSGEHRFVRLANK